MSKYRVFSDPYFPAFGLNTERWRSISPYSVRMQENTDQKILHIWTLFTQWILKNFCHSFTQIYVNQQLPHWNQVSFQVYFKYLPAHLLHNNRILSHVKLIHRNTQPAFTCSKSTIETPEQCVKSV